MTNRPSPYRCPFCRKELPEESTFCRHCGETFPDRGTVLCDRYEILGIIKAGAMGCVYKARDRRLDSTVAVKKMFSTHTTDEEREYAEKRFREEAQLLSSLHHGGLPGVIDYFTARDLTSEKQAHYLVMTFIEGKDLETFMTEWGPEPLPLDQALASIHTIAEILQYLHSQDPPVIYRDLKPSNIMVSSDRVFLVDFGIARVFVPQQKRTAIGTPGYAAPEQYKGMSEPRSDIYSLGVLMHYLLTGSDPEDPSRPPFLFEPARKLNPAVPEWLDGMITAMLDPVIEHRPPSMKEVLDVLDGAPSRFQARAVPARTPGHTITGTPAFPVVKAHIAWAILLVALWCIALFSHYSLMRKKSTLEYDRQAHSLPDTIGASIDLAGHPGEINSIAFSRDGRSLVSCCDSPAGGKITFWDLESRKEKWSGACQGFTRFSRASFSPDGKSVVSLNTEGSLVTWDASRGSRTRSLQALARDAATGEFYVGALALSRDGTVFTTSAQDRLLLRSVATGTCLKEFEVGSQPSGLLISPDNNSILCGGRSLRILNSSTGACTHQIEGAAENMCDFSPDGKLLAYSSYSQDLKKFGTITLYDMAANRCRMTIDAHPDHLSGICFSPDGCFIASTARRSSLVSVHDVKTGSCVHIFKGHSADVSAMAFSPDSRSVASGGFDRAVKIWRFQ
jgi:serine/threonine-protein kinase